MDHLVPPMEPEPPPDYLDFVRGQLPFLRHEAARLVDDAGSADQVYPAVLCDVARHWRLLRWQASIGRPDAAADYLRRRLARRARQWREERIYPVDVQVTAGPTPISPAPYPSGPYLSAPYPAAPARGRSSVMAPFAVDSVALQMAALLPGTVRAQAGTIAEAGIAWEHAFRQHCWWRLGRRFGAYTLLVAVIVGEMSRLSGG